MGVLNVNTRYNYFPLSVRGDLAPQPVYFFFFFLAAFFLVAIECLLEILGPDSDPDHLSIAANQVTREYCGTHFVLSTEKCTNAYHDRQERSMQMREQSGVVRNILYGIGVAVIIVVTLWRLIPR